MRRHHLPAGIGRLTAAPRWRIAPAPDPEAADALAEALSLPLPLAKLLVQRGFAEEARARAFLRPTLDALADPHTLSGMADAVALITAAVSAKTPILVHGDYDVDGQCATAVLTRALRMAGATVYPFVPHRTTDGYDFGAAGLAEADRVGAGLILTCDCGTNAIEAVAAAKAAGRQVIITDHHLPGPILPEADAIVNPQRADDRAGLGMMCGTGIAFKLVQALVEPLRLPASFPMHLLDYVAIATVADVVPLVGENRILVKHGLRLLQDSRWPGLRALLAQCDLAGKPVRAGQVGFTLAPRLNAVGRIADAKDGVRLLLADDEGEAAELASRLERLNRERQALDQQIQDDAMAIVERDFADPVAFPAIVLAGEGWHPGVIGIVASRVVERYGRPTFLIGLDGVVGKGSGRSIDGFDLHAALTACGDLLIRYGGHKMAAGLTIASDQLEQFRARFVGVARAQLTLDDLGPTQRVDLELPLAEVTDELERMGRHLEPCGMGNAAPVLGTRHVRLQGTRTVGEKHLKASLAADGRILDAIAFGWADRAAGLAEGFVDVAFRLERNEFRGVSSLQARVLSLAPARRA